MDTIEYATLSYDTVEVGKRLKCRKQFQYNFSKLFPFLKAVSKADYRLSQKLKGIAALERFF